MVFSGVLFIHSLPAKSSSLRHQMTPSRQITSLLFLHLPPMRQREANRVMQVHVYLLAPPRLYVPPHQLRLALCPSLEQPNTIPELTCLNLSGRRLAALVSGIRVVQARADTKGTDPCTALAPGLPYCGSDCGHDDAPSIVGDVKCTLPSSSPPAKPVVRNRRHWQISTNLVKPKR
jgi:hypothetical protein